MSKTITKTRQKSKRSRPKSAKAAQNRKTQQPKNIFLNMGPQRLTPTFEKQHKFDESILNDTVDSNRDHDRRERERDHEMSKFGKCSNASSVLMLQVKKMADVIMIETTFNTFERLLKQRKRDCVKQAKLSLLSSSNNIGNSNNNHNKDSDNSKKIICIETSFISNIIKSIGIMDDNLSEKMYRLRELELDCLKTMEQLTILDQKIEKYKTQFNEAKYFEYPRIANEINNIKATKITKIIIVMVLVIENMVLK